MPQIYGKTNQTGLPTAAAEAAQVQPRLGKYGEQWVNQFVVGKNGIALPGQYFTATHQTPGTAFTAAIQTTFSATVATVALRNTDAAAGKFIILDYMRFVVAVIPASATSAQFAVALDNANRVSSGGTAFTAVNRNMNSTAASIASATVGAITATAASGNVRYVSRAAVRNVIPVLGDQFHLNFGQVGAQGANSGAAEMGPVILGPGANHSVVLHMWNPGNATTAGQYEFEIGWWEL